jgi:hypothetical protein
MGDLGDEVLASERYKHEKRQSSSFMTPDVLLNNSINSVANGVTITSALPMAATVTAASAVRKVTELITRIKRRKRNL